MNKFFEKKFLEKFILLFISFYIVGWASQNNFFDFRFTILIPFFISLFLYFKKLLCKKFLIPIIIFVAIIIFQSLVYKLDLLSDKYFLQSLIGILIVYTVAYLNYESIKKNLEIFINYSFIIIIIFQFLSFFLLESKTLKIDGCYLFLYKFPGNFLFSEDSHYGITICSILIYSAIKFYEVRSLYNFFRIFTLVLISINFFSFTLNFSIIILCFFYILFSFFPFSKTLFPKKYNLLAVIMLIFYLSTLALSNCYDKFTDFGTIFKLHNIESNKIILETKKEDIRLASLSDIDEINVRPNLSSTVFLFNLKILYRSLFDYPFGIGFNRFEYAHNQYKDKISFFYNEEKTLNYNDASSNFIKLNAELGIFGFAIMLFILYYIFLQNNNLLFKLYLISSLLILFIRGAGYFNAGFAFFLIICILDIYYCNEKK